ncbi:hypothetical protein ACWPKO_03825 [Coraliomargarita sp. W4R53]
MALSPKAGASFKLRLDASIAQTTATHPARSFSQSIEHSHFGVKAPDLAPPVTTEALPEK